MSEPRMRPTASSKPIIGTYDVDGAPPPLALAGGGGCRAAEESSAIAEVNEEGRREFRL